MRCPKCSSCDCVKVLPEGTERTTKNLFPVNEYDIENFTFTGEFAFYKNAIYPIFMEKGGTQVICDT